MITCPWCGTNYVEFQTNCDNCGGSLPLPVEQSVIPLADIDKDTLPLSPPLPPRQIPPNHTWRLLGTDSAAIVSFVFSLLGAIFTMLGIIMTLAIVTAFVGIPFAILGLIFLGVGIPVGIKRYQYAQEIVEILRSGDVALGEITAVRENFHVRINRRYPWEIHYRFRVGERDISGKVTTLSRPSLKHQPGKRVYVLYDHDKPELNGLFPSPYGYYDNN